MAKGESEDVRDILVSMAASDSAAFALLYDIYYERIFSYCVSRVRVRQIAEDFTSATFLSAARTSSKFRGRTRAEFADRLYSIATAKINRYLRKKRILKSLRLLAEAEDFEAGTITWPMLHNAILKLAPKDQAIVALRFFEDLDVDRIAEITGSRPEVVRLRIAKALESIEIFGMERQFEDAVKGLDIDNAPDGGHKERLRAKIPGAFNAPGGNRYWTFLYLSAAAVVLIVAGLFVLMHSFGRMPPVLPGFLERPEMNQPQQEEEKPRLEKIRQLAAEKNIAELLEILKSDDVPAKLLAAKYLAELTDSNAADIMELVTPAERRIDVNKPAVHEPEQQKTVAIKTIDKKTKQPLGGVSLRIGFDGEANAPEVSTDSNGQYLQALPAGPPGQMQISAAVRGYATMRVQRRAAAGGILFEMPQVLEVGGLVVGEELEPVENAEVRVRTDSRFNLGIPAVDIEGMFKTDVNGAWRCSSFPSDACEAEVMVTHPDYIPQENYLPAVVEQLQNFSYLTILERGAAVSGRVLDWDKKPLRAVVIRGEYYESRNTAICDANGVFRFVNIPSGTEIFTAQCAGASPQIQQADVGPNAPPIIFNLEPAKTIRARVVDVNGAPVEGVDVKVSSWQGVSSLNFETRTDANGFFQWTDAPADEVLFDLYKPGYSRLSNFEMTSENDYVITLETQ